MSLSSPSESNEESFADSSIKLGRDTSWKGLWKVKAPSPYVSLETFGQTLNALNSRVILEHVK